MTLWLNSPRMFILADGNSMPLLVKFDEHISYMPVFESMSCAREALANLPAATAEHVLKTHGAYRVEKFSWELFRQQYEHHKKLGMMLFVYPMSPADYGCA